MKPSFNVDIYSTNKVNQLNDSGETHHGVEPGQWTRQDLERVLREVGLTYLQHYQNFGMHEHIVPYPFWDEMRYYRNKAYQLNSIGEAHSGVLHGEWTPENTKAPGIAIFPLNPYPQTTPLGAR